MEQKKVTVALYVYMKKHHEESVLQKILFEAQEVCWKYFSPITTIP